MSSKKINIPYESLLIVQMVIYLFSHNFHSLWLICDLIIGLNFILVLQKRLMKDYLLTFIFLSSLALFILYNQFTKGFHFISLLGFWDTYKHIFLFIFSFYLIREVSEERKANFINQLYLITTFAFFIQVIVVLIQQKLGLHFDNIAGTLGDGSTHSLAYFSIFYIVFLITHNKSIFLTIFVVILSMIINYFAENIGFYLLLGVSLFFVLGSKIGTRNMILISVLAGSLFVVKGLKGEFAQKSVGRIGRFSVSNNYSGADKLKAERGIMTGYAVYLGGLWGKGMGAYSEIYGQEGWEFYKLMNDQICISEATHLIAEIGIVGLLTTIITFIFLVISGVKKPNIRVYGIFLFILGMFYNRFLIDERIFFFFLLTLLIWSLSKTKSKENNIYVENSNTAHIL
jgi:hypothetical protein